MVSLPHQALRIASMLSAGAEESAMFSFDTFLSAMTREREQCAFPPCLPPTPPPNSPSRSAVPCRVLVTRSLVSCAQQQVVSCAARCFDRPIVKSLDRAAGTRRSSRTASRLRRWAARSGPSSCSRRWPCCRTTRASCPSTGRSSLSCRDGMTRRGMSECGRGFVCDHKDKGSAPASPQTSRPTPRPAK